MEPALLLMPKIFFAKTNKSASFLNLFFSEKNLIIIKKSYENYLC